jgi:hypothetical protein
MAPRHRSYAGHRTDLLSCPFWIDGVALLLLVSALSPLPVKACSSPGSHFPGLVFEKLTSKYCQRKKITPQRIKIIPCALTSYLSQSPPSRTASSSFTSWVPPNNCLQRHPTAHIVVQTSHKLMPQTPKARNIQSPQHRIFPPRSEASGSPRMCFRA